MDERQPLGCREGYGIRSDVAMPVVLVEVLQNGEAVLFDGCTNFVLSAFDDAACDEGAAGLQEFLYEAAEGDNNIGYDVCGDDIVVIAQGLAHTLIGEHVPCTEKR